MWGLFSQLTHCDGVLNNASKRIGSIRLISAQFSALVILTPWLMLANIGNATALLVGFWGTPRFTAALLWAASIFIFAGYIYYSPKLQPAGAAKTANAMARAVVNAFGLGACWAALPLFFFQQSSPGLQALIACLSAGMLCGGAFALARMPAAALSFGGPIFAASLATLLMSGQKDHLLTAALLLVYAGVLIGCVLVYSDEFKTRVLLRIGAEERARLRVEKLLNSKIRIVAGITSGIVHEVNQPLSAATMYLHTALKLLRRDPALRKADPEEVLQQALAQIAKAGRVIGWLRDFDDGDASGPAQLHIHPLIEQACCPLEAAGKTSVELRLEAKCDAIYAERAHIDQALAGQLGAAMDAATHSSAGRITVSTSLTKDGFLNTEIRVFGVGAAPAGEFPAEDGVGVGLAISRSIIEAHGGTIWLEPASEGSAAFCFSLPLASTNA
jgi:signal transduction histidine kinase